MLDEKKTEKWSGIHSFSPYLFPISQLCALVKCGSWLPSSYIDCSYRTVEPALSFPPHEVGECWEKSTSLVSGAWSLVPALSLIGCVTKNHGLQFSQLKTRGLDTSHFQILSNKQSPFKWNLIWKLNIQNRYKCCCWGWNLVGGPDVFLAALSSSVVALEGPLWTSVGCIVLVQMRSENCLGPDQRGTNSWAFP